MFLASFDSSEWSTFPKISLFGTSKNVPLLIINNSVKFQFTLAYSLPELDTDFYYSLEIKLNLNVKSKVLFNTIYHNLMVV